MVFLPHCMIVYNLMKSITEITWQNFKLEVLIEAPDAACTKFQTEVSSKDGNFHELLDSGKKKKQNYSLTLRILNDQECGDEERFGEEDFFWKSCLVSPPCPPEERGGRFYLYSPWAEEGRHKDYMEIVCLVFRETWLLFKSCLEMVKDEDRSASCSDGRNKLGWDVRDWSTPESFSIFPIIAPGGSPPGQLQRKDGTSQSKVHYLQQRKSSQIQLKKLFCGGGFEQSIKLLESITFKCPQQRSVQTQEAHPKENPPN